MKFILYMYFLIETLKNQDLYFNNLTSYFLFYKT